MTQVAASAFEAGVSLSDSLPRAVPTTCFMFLYGIAWVSLILIYLSEVRRAPTVDAAAAR